MSQCPHCGLWKKKSWKTTEIRFMRENYQKLGTKECARQLSRSRRSVCDKAIFLGLTRKNKRKDGK